LEEDAAVEAKLQKYNRVSADTRRRMRQIYVLLPKGNYADAPDFDRQAPAAMAAYHASGIPRYSLKDSPQLARLVDHPEWLLEHQRLDVPGRQFFPVKVLPPAECELKEADPTKRGVGDILVFPYPESHVRIEALLQSYTTGSAVVEYRRQLRRCGLVPGVKAPRYRLDALTTDPLKADAGWLRHQFGFFMADSDDPVTCHVDDDDAIGRIRKSVLRMGEVLDSEAPYLRQGMLGVHQTSGELLESSGKYIREIFTSQLGTVNNHVFLKVLEVHDGDGVV
jgi:hypothetical protein